MATKRRPIGGKWSYDTENRKPYPSKRTPPRIQFPDSCQYYREACDYVNQNFPHNPGNTPKMPYFPMNFDDSQQWLQNFLRIRFRDFGVYQDAIVAHEYFLHHSALTPMLNVGLILPGQVVSEALDFAESDQVPINSLEGFIRQILGWREYMRGLYLFKGRYQRTNNFWGFSRKMPEAFYHGSTGIKPLDNTIRKVLKTGYCHHIERLMVLGNFMLLCEIDPSEVYRWFMELFVDAYDWVMVPNVYGMSQYADGGIMSTKPYISGSNYLNKMSDYPNGPWRQIWDALFWRFIQEQQEYLATNPRMKLLVYQLDTMDKNRKKVLLRSAEDFLAGL